MIVAYLSHPVGVALGSAEDFVAQRDNLANVIDWVRFLVRYKRTWSIELSWYAYIVALGEDGRPLGIPHNFAKLERSDIAVQVGGNISPHMGYEQREATRRGIPNVDLTGMGYTPPWDWDERKIVDYIDARASAAMTLVVRTPWMPPLGLADIELLRDIRRRLVPRDREDHAQALIDRIILAATRR